MRISIAELIPVLQTAIGPVILINGVGLLLLTMTNRLARVIDRSRLLIRETGGAPDEGTRHALAELRVLWHRARLIRMAITLVAVSAFCAALLIVLIFITALAQLEAGWLIILVFAVGMASLVAGMGAFIHDINLSLAALEVELPEL